MFHSYASAGLIVVMLTHKAFACSYIDDSAFFVLSQAEKESYLGSCQNNTVIIDKTGVITDKESPAVSALTHDSLEVVNWLVDQDSADTFWDDWAKQLDAPVLSSKLASNFYGLGVWLPERYSSIDFDDAMELLKKYGLQMSVGFGGEDSDSPRIRFDYRWHDENELDDVFIQVEFPFQ